MDYKLAKQLKDAGWPQFFSEGMDYYDKKGGFCTSACSDYNHDQDWAIRVPTLSELIAACGASFDFLGLRTGVTEDLSKAKFIWEAHGDTNDLKPIYAPSPEEAVARLWLALQPRNNS